MIVRRSAIPLMILVLALAQALLAGCDTSSASNPQQSNRAKAGWRPPTPFPPLVYPTDGPAQAEHASQQQTAPSTDQANTPLLSVQGRLQQDLLQVELDAQKVRGLEPKSDVQEKFISKEQLRANLLQVRDKGYTREDARQDELELWNLRFVDEPSLDLYQLQADMLSEELLGYYDPDKKELYVLSGQTHLDAEARETLAHEFVHSLQDQYYGLDELLSGGQHNGDHSLAARSLVEGDATLSGLLYADEFMSADEFKKLTESGNAQSPPASLSPDVPDIFQETLDFPYTRGTTFVKTLYTRGGFASVNKALADPPHSTEQIMHPEKYLQTPRDEPVAVGLPPLTDTLGAGWVYKDSDTIGEFELGVLLRTNGVSRPEAAVAGWGGGQYDLYENGTNSLLFMGTIWDTQRDAIEFETALRQSLVSYRRFGSLWSDGTRYFTMKRLKNRVIYAGGTDRTAVQNAPGAIK